MSFVLPNAKEKYERREEQNFREWVRRNVENATNLAQNAGGGTGDVFVGDSGSGGEEGIVPAPATGDATKFLKGDGTWGVPSGLVGSVAWGAITGTLTDQTDLDTALDGKSDTSHTHAYSSLTGIPATFAPSAHSHSAFTGDSGAGGAVGFVPAPVAGDAAAGKYLDSDGTWTVPPVGGGGAAWGTITGTLSAQSDLNTALVGKSDTSHTHAYSSLTSIPSTFAPSAHTHPWADVTGEPTTLAGYGIVDAAPLVHTHAWADVTGEPTTLAGYGITDAQALDADLTALAALSTNGVMVRTGTATFAVRTITGTSGEITVTAGDGVSGNPTLSLDADIKTTMLQFVIDGGGSAITTGIKGDLYTDFNGTITSCVILADQSGSIVVDIWEDTYTNFPPLVADTITASAKPTISATNKSKDTTLTGWQKTISPDSVLRFNVDSCATITPRNHFSHGDKDLMATAAIIGAFDNDTAQAASYAITATPAANLLMVVFADVTATAVATPGLTCSVGGTSFSYIGRQARGTGSHYLWVANQLTTNVAHTITVDVTGDNGTGGNIGLIGVSGMTRKGTQAVKQSKSATGAAAVVPQTVFDASALTANLILSGIAYDAALGPETVPSTFTLISNTSYATPSTSLEVVKKESAFTTTTITWGTAPAVGIWSLWSIELDVSAAPLGRSSVGLVT